ncbi:MAG: uracil permease, partial [Pseudomonas sp.]
MQDGFNDPLWRQVVSGAQMLFVAFGALVLMPLITGLDPNVALFTAGIGTLLFQLVTGRQVPVFLASSFAFITPIILAKGQFGLAETMGGVMAAGFVYTFMGMMVKIKGTGFIDRMLPPVVIGPVIISIGLAMAPIAANMAMGKGGDGAVLIPYQTAMLISMPALLTTLIVAVFGKGIFRLVPIIAGVLVGFAMAFAFGVVDTARIAAAPWLAIPHFTAPAFNWQAILFIVPVALAPAIEHIGGVIAVGSVTGRD